MYLHNTLLSAHCILREQQQCAVFKSHLPCYLRRLRGALRWRQWHPAHRVCEDWTKRSRKMAWDCPWPQRALNKCQQLPPASSNDTHSALDHSHLESFWGEKNPLNTSGKSTKLPWRAALLSDWRLPTILFTWQNQALMIQLLVGFYWRTRGLSERHCLHSTWYLNDGIFFFIVPKATVIGFVVVIVILREIAPDPI